MRKSRKTIKSNLIFFITMIISIFLFSNYFCESKVNEDLFNEIITNTKGSVLEYGVTTSFYVEDNGEVICKQIKSYLDANTEVKESKNDKLYYLEFKGNKIQGYIQSLKNEGKNLITLNLYCKDNKNQLEEFKNKIQTSVGKVNSNGKNKYFCYVKAKISNEDLTKTNEEIMSLLKEKNAKRIETIKLDNGYNTVCYTGKYDVIEVNREIVDFNYAICRYKSGNYIIIGTPQIIMNY